MDPKPSSRIVNWLRDFDQHMRIRWSRSFGAFSVERKARISDRLRDAMHYRANLAFNPHESGSPHHERILALRKLAVLQLEAAREGYATICTVTGCEPSDEAELIEYLTRNDPWRHGHPDHKGKDYVATTLADEARETQEAQQKATVNPMRREIAARSRDAAKEYWRRTGQRINFGRGTKRAVRDAKRAGKVA